MEDWYEMLINDLSKRCEISKNQARVVADYLDRSGFLEESAIETHYMEQYEL